MCQTEKRQSFNLVLKGFSGGRAHQIWGFDFPHALQSCVHPPRCSGGDSVTRWGGLWRCQWHWRGAQNEQNEWDVHNPFTKHESLYQLVSQLITFYWPLVAGLLLAALHRCWPVGQGMIGRHPDCRKHFHFNPLADASLQSDLQRDTIKSPRNQDQCE